MRYGCVQLAFNVDVLLPAKVPGKNKEAATAGKRNTTSLFSLFFYMCLMHPCFFVFLFFFSLSLVSLIRGQVVTTDGTPLVGVNVSFPKYPKYGYTITRQDGT